MSPTLNAEDGQPVKAETGTPLNTEGVILVMTPFPATIAPGKSLRLIVTPEDASGAPAQAPGPIVWAFATDGMGTLTPSTDGTSCLYASTTKQGVAKITASIPTVPTVPSVEFDITVALPLATQLVPSVAAV